MIFVAIVAVAAIALAVMCHRAEKRADDAEDRALVAELKLVAAQDRIAALEREQRRYTDRAKLLAREVRADDRYDTMVWSGAKPSPVMWRPGREVTPYEG